MKGEGNGPAPMEESELEQEFFGDGNELSDSEEAEGTAEADVESGDEAAMDTAEVGVEEGEENEPVSVRDWLFGAFKSTADRIKNRFTGEVGIEDQEDHETTKTEFAGAVAAGLVGIAMTRTGTKFFADMPQYLSQKYFTSKERSSIMSAIESSDLGVESEDGESAVEAKNKAITERINKSTFLTEGKKAELIDRLTGISERYQGEYAALDEDRNREFAEVLEESIQSRISNTAMLKETLNTAMIATGVATLRTVGYSAVALYERHKTVSSEMKEGKRTGSYFSELVAGGAKETWNDLTKGGDGETLMKRNITRAKAAGILLRGAALGHLAGAEIFSDENITGAISKSLDVFQEKGVAGGIAAHLGEHFGSMFGGGDVETGDGADGELVDDDYVDQGPEQFVDDDAPDVVEGVGGVEAPEITILHGDELERATVGADSGHNSIIALLKNQITADPEKFGFEGDSDDLNDWALDQATDAARDGGLLSSTGDVRLTSGSIDNLIVQATEKDGEIGVHFIDSNTGKPLDVEGLQDAGYTYEHGDVDGSAVEIAAEPSAVETAEPIAPEEPAVEEALEPVSDLTAEAVVEPEVAAVEEPELSKASVEAAVRSEAVDSFDTEEVADVAETGTGSKFEFDWDRSRMEDTDNSTALASNFFTETFGTAREVALKAFAQHEIGTWLKDGHVPIDGDTVQFNRQFMILTSIENSSGGRTYTATAEGISVLIDVPKEAIDRAG
ncbi:hypothetical protein HQ524_01380 [Candidatus Uhrbacteria bacterium]|nr:hypothetical protein [Candidatus Uhrbacteria bacterium]